MRFLVVVAALVAAVGALPTYSNPGWVVPAGSIGLSGIVRRDGTIEGFTGDFTRDIVAIGPSGIVTKSGANVQLDSNLHRVRRAYAGFTRPEGSVGYSGIVRADGTVDAFSGDFSHDIVAIGASGIVTKSGKNVQLTPDLHRVKRHIIGDSGMLTSWGQAVVFKKPFTTILLDGPGGIVLSDGQLLQKPSKY